MSRLLSLVLSASLFTLGFLAPAHAATVNFNCGTSGTYQVDDATHTITGNTACAGVLNIDSSVTAIGNDAFKSNESLTAITIPGSVTSIGSHSFDAAYFDSITFNEGLLSIGAYAFANTYNRGNKLNIYLPNSLTTIGASAFVQARFGSFSVGENVTSLGEGAFYNNFGEGPTSIVFRGTSKITSIGNFTFIGYLGEEIVLPPDITSVGVRAFESANQLKYIYFPAGVTSIGNEIFGDASALEFVMFPDGLTTIGTEAFKYYPPTTSALKTVLYCGSDSTVQNYSYPNSVHPVCAKSVIFRPNGGSGSTSIETGTTLTALTANSFTRGGGYSFTGWNTKADGSGTSYTNGQQYNFAANLVLYAQWGSTTAPGTPTIGTARTISETSASVDFSAPASDGGATIDKYECISSPASSTITLNQAGSGTCTFSGLTTGTAYQFKVRAHNSIGYSSYSSLSASIKPSSAPVDNSAAEKEAERRRQEKIDAARKDLVAKIKKGEVVVNPDLTESALPTLNVELAKKANTEFAKQSTTADFSFENVQKIVSKYEVYQNIEEGRIGIVTGGIAAGAGILPADITKKEYILYTLLRMDPSYRLSVEVIDKTIQELNKAQLARQEKTAAIITKIAARRVSK